MPKVVYVLGDINSSPMYFNTRKEADATWRNREEPERVETVDAAAQCTHLQAQVDELEEHVQKLTYWLVEMLSIADNDNWKQTAVRDAISVLIRVDPSHIDLPDLLKSYERINGRPHPDADKYRRD